MNESEATTLERIHAAAEKEFLEHGFQAASLRRIVKEAGFDRCILWVLCEQGRALRGAGRGSLYPYDDEIL